MASGSSFGFRKHWSRRKSDVHRGYRRTQSTLLSGASALADGAIADEVDARVADTAASARPTPTGRPSGPYRPDTQRARTEEALQRITRPRPGGHPGDGGLRHTTRAVNDLLPHRVNPHVRRSAHLERQRGWFAAFLDDVPEWEARLARWIAETHRAAG